MINFVDFCDPEQLAPYLDRIIAAALTAMQAGPRIVQEQAVAVVSSAAMVMEEALGEANYGGLMPLLQAALLAKPLPRRAPFSARAACAMLRRRPSLLPWRRRRELLRQWRSLLRAPGVPRRSLPRP